MLFLLSSPNTSWIFKGISHSVHCLLGSNHCSRFCKMWKEKALLFCKTLSFVIWIKSNDIWSDSRKLLSTTQNTRKVFKSIFPLTTNLSKVAAFSGLQMPGIGLIIILAPGHTIIIWTGMALFYLLALIM